MEAMLHITAQLLVQGTGAPLENRYLVRLMDQDPFMDDLLGTAQPDVEGRVEFTVNPKSFRTPDSFAEKLPDLYLEVLDGAEEVYTSPVAENVDYMKAGKFDSTTGASIDMGVFLINI